MTFSEVTGPRARPPLTGLVAAAAGLSRDTGERWQDGLVWVSEQCAGYRLVPYCTTDEPADFDPPGDTAVYVEPVVAQFMVECSTLARRASASDAERLLRHAEATTPFVVARELWTGAGSDLAPFDTPEGDVGVVNPRLASAAADVLAGGPYSAKEALGRLEYAAGEALRGQQVWLHIPRHVMPQLDGDLRRVGNVNLTRRDSVVIDDAGYPGSGPAGQAAGATVWAYATGPVDVRLEPSARLVTDVPGQIIVQATNRRVLQAERLFAVSFAPCVHFAVEINV